MPNLLLCAAVTLLLSLQTVSDDVPGSPDRERSPLTVTKLTPKLERKQVTVKFTVAQLQGIAQRARPGQAPSFAIYAKREHDTKRLEVWVEGELANVLHRLQMSFLQANQLKAGTIIVVTGTLRMHEDRSDGELYAIHVDKWQNFRIVAMPKHNRKE